MMERREQARKHGFTEMIDCGAVTLHVFHEDALYQNLPLGSKNVINLGSISFPDEQIPLLERSGIEILPGVGHRSAELYGYIAFDAPTAWDKQGSFENQLSALQEHLENIVGFDGSEFKHTEDTLAVRSESRQDARISFKRLDYTTVCAEIYAPIDETKPQSFLYDDIVSHTHLWGEIHNFIVRCSTLPYKQPANATWNTIYIGTTPEMIVSDMELALESQIGERQIVNSQAPIIGWADDIRSSVIDAYQQGLPAVCDIDMAAETIVRAKHDLSHRLGQPVSITQRDIIQALAQHVKGSEGR